VASIAVGVNGHDVPGIIALDNIDASKVIGLPLRPLALPAHFAAGDGR